MAQQRQSSSPLTEDAAVQAARQARFAVVPNLQASDAAFARQKQAYVTERLPVTTIQDGVVVVRDSDGTIVSTNPVVPPKPSKSAAKPSSSSKSASKPATGTTAPQAAPHNPPTAMSNTGGKPAAGPACICPKQARSEKRGRHEARAVPAHSSRPSQGPTPLRPGGSYSPSAH